MYQVGKLREGSDYYLRVMAENSVGVGKPVETPTSVEVKSPYGEEIICLSLGTWCSVNQDYLHHGMIFMSQ